MVELLDLELLPIEKLNWGDDEAVVMVDSQPKTGRHNLNGGDAALRRHRSPRHAGRI